ncbi:MAG: ribosome biogenesis GTP-binding protein YihA/YsxC [Eubacteriales bacterium]|nr:ribosome biogenesis GTP-binding protein YihA/YsxC [Eubacteriales bacterium]MDY3333123.1 ribosome biogenesis GTP-binding protein YihA/YsxC [Gallibacter sp.]
MKIKKSEIVAVTGNPSQYPEDNMKEIAFAGRSNVGKSSLLNMITNRKKLAKVSSSPGKTQTINFYEINDKFRIVDLPGYGYAKVSRSLSNSWGNMMDQYFNTREGLVTVIQLIDIRHEPTKQDIQMYEYLKHFNLDGIVVATKADKISRNEINKNVSVIRKKLKMEDHDIVIPTSSLKKTGYDELLDIIEQLIEL